MFLSNEIMLVRSTSLKHCIMSSGLLSSRYLLFFMQARLALAAGAGCSRAISEHAVAHMSSFRDTEAASPDGAGGLAGTSVPSGGTRLHVLAACWRYQAEQRGCARAVCRADVMTLVGLMKPTGSSGEPPQVSPWDNPALRLRGCSFKWGLRCSEDGIGVGRTPFCNRRS